ncbi:MAG TPA: agmatinase [Candidatus Korarchaeota archaeon]|nr:agmatinase [Candidatus Korarchaeota archaeon]
MPRPRGPWAPERAFLGFSVPYEDADYVIIPVPYDSTSTWRPGARFGPQSIIDASRFLEPYDPQTGVSLSEVRIHTLPELDLPRGDHEGVLSLIQNIVSDVISDGKTPVVIGGEHSITIGAFRGACSRLPLGYISLDAHLDMYDSYEGTRYGHASVSARCSETASFAAVIGARSAGLEELSLAQDRGVMVIWAWRLGQNPSSILDEVLGGRRGSKVYVSVDVDVFDPSVIPCTGCPEPGGLEWYQVVQALDWVLTAMRPVALDFTELGECFGRHDAPYTVAKLIAHAIAIIESHG